MTFNIASLIVEEGTLHWTDQMTSPPTDLSINALSVTVRDIALNQPMEVEATGTLPGETPGRVHFSGRITLPEGLERHGSIERMQLAFKNLQLEQVLPAAPPGAPQLRGELLMTFQGNIVTLDPVAVARSISGKGELKLDKPVIVNLNILREVFKKFSIIPGLVQRLESRLPAEYQAKLAANDTVLAPVDLAMQLDGGVMRLNNLTLQTDTFGLSGAGTASLSGLVSIQSVLRIEPAFSSALIRSVNELQSLANPKGELEIPLAISGQAPQIAVLPDVNYLASKVIVTKAVDLLSELLGPKDETPPNETTPAEQDTTPAEDPLTQFLQRAIQKHVQRDTSPQSAQP
jgi:hypothetical protein